MFMWRALAANLRVTFPDVVLGLYTPEELGANVSIGENDQMEIIDVQPSQETKTDAKKRLERAKVAFVGKGVPIEAVNDYIHALRDLFLATDQDVLAHLTELWNQIKEGKKTVEKVFVLHKVA